MYQTYNDLPDDDIKVIIAQYSYDYFFHYLLIQSSRIRLALCRFMSGDESIQETFIENSETYKPYHNGKKLIMDVVVRDDQERFYNFEMQNYNIESDDEMRMTRYLDRLFDMQERKGLSYDEMKDIFQLIFYTGKPLNNFHHYLYVMKKGDFKYGAVLEHQKAHATLLQLKQMKEDLEMDISLSTIHQLAYLFMNGKPHEESIMADEVKEAIELHEKYMNSSEVIKGYELERERMIIQSRMNRAKNEGIEIGKAEGVEIGKMEEHYQNVVNLIHLIYGEHDIRWLENCSFNQLGRATDLVKRKLRYEMFKEEMMK